MPRPSAVCRPLTVAMSPPRWPRWGGEALAFLLLAVASSMAWPQAAVHDPQGSALHDPQGSALHDPQGATLHYREGQRIDPQQVHQILSAGTAARGRTRSIRLLDGDAAAPSEAAAAAAPSALSAPVQFEFDSSLILPQAREQLDAIAEGIKLLPSGRAVVIEGHTDAAGSEDYNQQLSRRRAAAVKLYLAQHHGIALQRLRDIGVGERQPIEGLDPLAAENRRVQFRGG